MRFDEREMGQLDRLVARYGISRSAVIRAAVDALDAVADGRRESARVVATPEDREAVRRRAERQDAERRLRVAIRRVLTLLRQLREARAAVGDHDSHLGADRMAAVIAVVEPLLGRVEGRDPAALVEQAEALDECGRLLNQGSAIAQRIVTGAVTVQEHVEMGRVMGPALDALQAAYGEPDAGRARAS